MRLRVKRHPLGRGFVIEGVSGFLAVYRIPSWRVVHMSRGYRHLYVAALGVGCFVHLPDGWRNAA